MSEKSAAFATRNTSADSITSPRTSIPTARVLLFTTSTYGFARIYDMEKFLAVGDKPEARIGEVPIPGDVTAPEPVPGVRVLNITGTYHDFYRRLRSRDPPGQVLRSRRSAGYYIYDVTKPEEPKLLTSITGVAGGGRLHTFTPTPDGRYAVGETEYQYAPLRIFDLKPGLDGTVKTISPADRRLDRGLAATCRTTTKSAGPTSSFRPTRTGSRSST